jgi:hypothetical protein
VQSDHNDSRKLAVEMTDAKLLSMHHAIGTEMAKRFNKYQYRADSAAKEVKRLKSKPTTPIEHDESGDE